MKLPKPGDEIWLPVVLSALLILGLALIAAPALFGWTWDQGTLHEVGIALLIAAVLGLTVNQSLESRLARNVVEAALGYVFPDEFRAEVRQITSYKFFCERHRMDIRVEVIDAECVRVTWQVERKIKNISSTRQPIRGEIRIDEWGFPQESSRIIDCEAQVDGEEPVKYKEITRDGPRLRADTEEVYLRPGQSAKLSSRSVEIRRFNDFMSFVFLAPTKDPEATIDIPPELDCLFEFGSPHASTEKSKYSHHYWMTGTYFPHQHMNFRFWRKPQQS